MTMSENKNHDDAKPNIILEDEKNLLLDHEYDGIQELDNPMPAYGSGQRLSDDQLQQLSSYIISLRGSNPDNAKAPDMSRSIECQI